MNNFKRLNKRSFRIKSQLSEFKPISESVESVLDYRESPIDCPKIIEHVVERDENFNIIIQKTLNKASDDASNRRIIARNSSLSTIAEEKTMNSFTTLATTPGSSKAPHNTQNYNAFIVKEFLNDLKDHKMFLNEVKNVFMAAQTRDGEFYRNIAIRFKSSSDNSDSSASGI